MAPKTRRTSRQGNNDNLSEQEFHSKQDPIGLDASSDGLNQGTNDYVRRIKDFGNGLASLCFDTRIFRFWVIFFSI